MVLIEDTKKSFVMILMLLLIGLYSHYVGINWLTILAGLMMLGVIGDMQNIEERKKQSRLNIHRFLIYNLLISIALVLFFSILGVKVFNFDEKVNLYIIAGIGVWLVISIAILIGEFLIDKKIIFQDAEGKPLPKRSN